MHDQAHAASELHILAFGGKNSIFKIEIVEPMYTDRIWGKDRVSMRT